MSEIKQTYKQLEQELEVWRHGPSCWSCGDSGDVHQLDGEWLGKCDCLAAQLIDVTRERDQLKAKLAHQDVEAGTLAERMKAAGMMTVDEILAGAPLDAFTRHAGVNSLEAFGQWLEMRRREYVSMQARRTLDKREDDELYEWVLAHAGAFGEVHVNFRAAMSAREKKWVTRKGLSVTPKCGFSSFSATTPLQVTEYNDRPGV
ncbi:hypothetical protein D3C85_448540 [compost metagenome]